MNAKSQYNYLDVHLAQGIQTQETNSTGKSFYFILNRQLYISIRPRIACCSWLNKMCLISILKKRPSEKWA